MCDWAGETLKQVGKTGCSTSAPLPKQGSCCEKCSHAWASLQWAKARCHGSSGCWSTFGEQQTGVSAGLQVDWRPAFEGSCPPQPRWQEDSLLHQFQQAWQCCLQTGVHSCRKAASHISCQYVSFVLMLLKRLVLDSMRSLLLSGYIALMLIHAATCDADNADL